MTGPQHEIKATGSGLNGMTGDPFQGVVKDTRRDWLKVRFLEALLRCVILLFAATVIGFGLDNLFFLCPFPVRHIKPLKEITESDDVHQFMGENIYQKRQKRQVAVPL